MLCTNFNDDHIFFDQSSNELTSLLKQDISRALSRNYRSILKSLLFPRAGTIRIYFFIKLMMLNVFCHHQAYLLRIGIRFQTFLNSFGYTPTGCTVVLYHLDSSIICHSSFQKYTSIVIITKT